MVHILGFVDHRIPVKTTQLYLNEKAATGSTSRSGQGGIWPSDLSLPSLCFRLLPHLILLPGVR